MKGKFELNGYTFLSSDTYDKAKKELEAIDYIRTNTNLDNSELVLKIYNSLLNKATFQTVIGYEFLLELRDKLRKDTSIGKNQIKNIPVRGTENLKSEVKDENSSPKEQNDIKLKERYEKEKSGKLILKITIGFLVFIIAGMLVIAQYTPYSIFSNYEDKIIDKYIGWQEDLDAREAELDEREKALELK